MGPLVIILPQGINVSGVTAWACRLARGLSASGRPVVVAIHREPDSQRRLDEPMPGVIVEDLGLPAVEEPGEIEPLASAYAGVVERAAARFGGPVLVSPNLHADAYAAVALAMRRGHDLRVLGWAHSDNTYDVTTLERHREILSAVVGVSGVIARELRQRLFDRVGGRVVAVEEIPYGVEVPAAPPRREASSALRLLYAGRLEHHQKRILALPALSRELEARGVEHVLTIVGDGPAAGALADEARRCPRVRLLPAVSPARLSGLLVEHDALVLASRYEGLSVSMLEAMARGCVPIVTRVRSGAGEAIEPGVSGLIADAGPEADELEAGRALADAVASCAGSLGRMSRAAWRVARERYSIQGHVARVAELLARVEQGPALRPSAEASARTGWAPRDASDRARAVWERLAGRRVVVHGAGAHTRALLGVFTGGPGVLVAIADDDRQRHGQELGGVRIIDPARAGETGARDVVISSWMHEAAILSRRSIYERQGLAVHAMYAA